MIIVIISIIIISFINCYYYFVTCLTRILWQICLMPAALNHITLLFLLTCKICVPCVTDPTLWCLI